MSHAGAASGRGEGRRPACRTATSLFSTVSSPLYSTHHNAIYNLDPAGGGSGLTVGQLYTQFNIT